MTLLGRRVVELPPDEDARLEMLTLSESGLSETWPDAVVMLEGVRFNCPETSGFGSASSWRCGEALSMSVCRCWAEENVEDEVWADPAELIRGGV